MTTQINTLQYNELSQLKAKYLNGTATSHVQRQLYYYNVRGWLTRINDPNIYCDDVFAEKLYYNSVPNYATSIARGCYNGNISTTEWFTKNMVTTGYLNGYGYTYDGLNRLTAAIFFSLQNATGAMQQEPANTSNQDYGTITGIGSEKNITYDKNCAKLRFWECSEPKPLVEPIPFVRGGNMLTLNRYGRRSDGVVMFDQLSFQYAGNQLAKVIDAITGLNSLGDFRNTTSPAAKNEYDANGNLVFDVDRNMQLHYNTDNLPLDIVYDEGLVRNKYRSDGVKTNKMVYDGKGRLTLNETYLGNLVLNFGVPARIIHPEGVVELNSSLQPTFYYHLKDHLGNVRAVVTPTSTNTATISQTSEYYPFGMCYTKNPASYVNKYKFGGKEEQEMPGQYLDFGARFYDRQLPHFSSPDPLAELTIGVTPYHYCLNNPVSKIDPTGMWTTGLERNDAMMALEERISRDEGKNTEDDNLDRDKETKNNLPIDVMADRADDDNGGSNNNGKPSEGSTPSVGSNMIEGVGAALIKVGDKYYSAVITKEGKIVKLPTERAYNMFANSGKYVNLRSTANALKVGGKVITIAGEGATVVGVLFDMQAYKNGDIGGARFIYRLGITATSTIIGANIGGPPGAAAGVAIGVLGWLGEKVYDNVLKPALDRVSYEFGNMEYQLRCKS